MDNERGSPQKDLAVVFESVMRGLTQSNLEYDTALVDVRIRNVRYAAFGTLL